MSNLRLGAWALVVVGGMAGTVACVDGEASSNPGMAENVSHGGASGTPNVLGAGASGIGHPSAAGAPAANCTAPQVSCSGACVDLTSTAHCGTCEQACGSAQSCTAGVCTCPGALSACNGACVDIQSSVEHCGGCSKPCATGAACSAGVCGCAVGQELCNGVCVDLKQSAANCGACGTVCMAGQTCESGSCVTGAGADGCTGGPALGISVKKIDVYQTVKVPVMDAGAEITTDKRTTDVVAGRVTMFRLSVALDSGFSARQISGRVTVDNGATAAQYFAKQAVSKDSVETETASTFQVVVPAEQITADTRYSVELVECAAATGTAPASSPRFPKTGDVALAARRIGGLKVTIIPLQANNKLPDVTETALTTYRQQLMAMYPIDAVTLTVAPPLTIAYPVDWESTLDQMRAKRKTDNPAADIYYYGLLKPQDTFNAFCGNGCTTGIGYLTDQRSPGQRTALGVGFADRVSAQTMAHELGHNHGRGHAPCVPNGGSIAGVDSKYPFTDGRTGIIGYDSRTKALLSDKGTDLMGYCSNVWLSEYTYNAIADRIALVNGSQSQVVSAAALSTFRVLLVGSKGARWGVPITTPSLPEGTAITARVLDAAGHLLEEITVYRTEMSDLGAASIMVPEPKPGWSGVEVMGSGVVAFAR